MKTNYLNDNIKKSVKVVADKVNANVGKSFRFNDDDLKDTIFKKDIVNGVLMRMGVQEVEQYTNECGGETLMYTITRKVSANELFKVFANCECVGNMFGIDFGKEYASKALFGLWFKEIGLLIPQVQDGDEYRGLLMYANVDDVGTAQKMFSVAVIEFVKELGIVK